VAYHNGRELLTKCHTSSEDFIPYSKKYVLNYSKITLNEVNECIRKYFKKEYMSVCLIGGEHIPSLSVIEKECNKLRSKK
jgi:hypothetical protein